MHQEKYLINFKGIPRSGGKDFSQTGAFMLASQVENREAILYFLSNRYLKRIG